MLHVMVNKLVSHISHILETDQYLIFLSFIQFVKTDDSNGLGSKALEDKKAEDGKTTDDDDNKYKKKKGTEILNLWLSLVILAFCLSIFALVLYMDSRLPVPLTTSDSAKFPDRFIEVWLTNICVSL